MSSAHTVIAQTLCSSLVNNVITWKLLNMTLFYSQTFRILGSSTANQMLLFNRKLTAEEAAAHGFVSEVNFVSKSLLWWSIDQ